jgi:pimeloyl-ACP methyl ester carboxylesterase
MTSASLSLEPRHTEVDGLSVAYREAGTGPAVLLVHGWPTSSLLWRDVMPHLVRGVGESRPPTSASIDQDRSTGTNRVVAIDLPGYGASAKPLDRRYDATFYEEVIDGFLAALGIDRVALVVHDVGGPIGLHWALRNPDRVTGIGILNTLLYPEFSAAVVEFVQRLTTPGEREKMVGPDGLADLLRLGLRHPERLDPALLAEFVAPFAADEDAREALARAAIGLTLRQFKQIGGALPTIAVPVRVIYGRHDAVLPDIATTVERLRADIPHAEVTVLDDCAHFIQLEAPAELGRMLAEFLAALPARR